MKRKICVALSILLLTSLPAIATPRIGNRPSGTCTRDINSWGHASQCSCVNDKVYDERSGLCLKGNAAEKIIIQGEVFTGIMAIGGESTGNIIKTPNGLSYELILKITDQEKISKFSGMRVEIEGELITINGVEVEERKVIIADNIAGLEK